MLNFTDGIGKISEDLLEEINLKLKVNNDLGAIQVRYLGAKGVLCVDPELPRKTIVLRPSMVKYGLQTPQRLKAFGHPRLEQVQIRVSEPADDHPDESQGDPELSLHETAERVHQGRLVANLQGVHHF